MRRTAKHCRKQVRCFGPSRPCSRHAGSGSRACRALPSDAARAGPSPPRTKVDRRTLYASPRSLSIRAAAVPAGSLISGQSSSGSPSSRAGRMTPLATNSS